MKMGRKVFVNDRARSGEENLDPAGMVTVHDPVGTDAQAVKSLQLFIKGLRIAGRKRSQGKFDPPAGLRGKSAEIIADLPGDRDLNLQWRKAGKT